MEHKKYIVFFSAQKLKVFDTFPRFAIAADFNIRMIVVKVRQYRQGYPLTKINVLAYRISNCMKNVPKLMQFDIKLSCIL